MPCRLSPFLRIGTDRADTGRREAVNGGDAPTHGQQARLTLHLIAGAHTVRQLRRAATEATDAALQAEEKRVELCVREERGGASARRRGGDGSEAERRGRACSEKEENACFRHARSFCCCCSRQYDGLRRKRERGSEGLRMCFWVGFFVALSLSLISRCVCQAVFLLLKAKIFANPRAGGEIGLPGESRSVFYSYGGGKAGEIEEVPAGCL